MIGLVSPAGAFVGQIKREKHSRDYGESGEMGARLAFSYGHFSRFEKSGRGKLCSASSKPSLKCSLACQRSANRPISVGERSRLDAVISDVACALLDGIGRKLRDRVGDAGM